MSSTTGTPRVNRASFLCLSRELPFCLSPSCRSPGSDSNCAALNHTGLLDCATAATINSIAIVAEEVVNNELVEAIVTMVVDPANEYAPGGVLVFVPGLMEITNLLEQLASNPDRLPPDKVRVFPLHSTLSTAEQQRVFEPVPHGVRKVVISTNIAETSVTIDDIVYVIDTGRWGSVPERHFFRTRKLAFP